MLRVQLALAPRSLKVFVGVVTILAAMSAVAVPALAVAGLVHWGWAVAGPVLAAGLLFGGALVLEEGSSQESSEFAAEISLARKFRRQGRMSRSQFREFKRRVRAAAREYVAVTEARQRLASAIEAEHARVSSSDLLSELLDKDRDMIWQARGIFSALRGSAERAADPERVTPPSLELTQAAFRAALAARNDAGSAALRVYR